MSSLSRIDAKKNSAPRRQPKTLAEVLSAELKARDLSTAEVARQSGVPQSAVWSAVNGASTSPGWLTVLAILTAIDRDLAWLHRQGIRPTAI